MVAALGEAARAPHEPSGHVERLEVGTLIARAILVKDPDRAACISLATLPEGQKLRLLDEARTAWLTLGIAPDGRSILGRAPERGETIAPPPAPEGRLH